MKRPRFYCEYCGYEVRGDARLCPRCGRFFSSVKCPRCGFTGESEDFAAGCPECGYALTANPPPEDMRAPSAAAPSLPWWAYPLAAALVLVLVLILIGLMR